MELERPTCDTMCMRTNTHEPLPWHILWGERGGGGVQTTHGCHITRDTSNWFGQTQFLKGVQSEIWTMYIIMSKKKHVENQIIQKPRSKHNHIQKKKRNTDVVMLLVVELILSTRVKFCTLTLLRRNNVGLCEYESFVFFAIANLAQNIFLYTTHVKGIGLTS